MLQTVIIDDEPESLEVLQKQLQLFCPNVQVLACCDQPAKGLEAIVQYKPQLVFLDIEMPGMTGFEMLERIPPYNFNVIFTTAYNHYAVQAFQLSALDYLLKPIDKELLISAVAKAEQKYAQEDTLNRLEVMLDLLAKGQQGAQKQAKKIVLPIAEKKIIKQMENILCIEAQENYCRFHFDDGTALQISKNIGFYDKALDAYDIMRVSRFYMANLHKVEAYLREGYLKLSAYKDQIWVSKSKREILLDRLKRL